MMDFFDSNLVLVQATFIGLVLALSVQVPLRMGVFSFAGAGSYGIGAYLAGIITIKYETPGIVAVPTTMVFTAVIGLVLGLVISRLAGPLPGHGHRRLRPHHLGPRHQRRRAHRRSDGSLRRASDFGTIHLAIVTLVVLVSSPRGDRPNGPPGRRGPRRPRARRVGGHQRAPLPSGRVRRQRRSRRRRRRDQHPGPQHRHPAGHRLRAHRPRPDHDHRRRRTLLEGRRCSAPSSSPGCPSCSRSWATGSR